jgi:hypothetical protein
LGRCAGADAQRIAIDLVKLRKAAASIPFSHQPACSVRFKLSVDVPAGTDPNAYESAFESIGADGIVSVLTNGEPPGNSVPDAVNAAFDRGASKLIVDKRRGDGGGGDALEVWDRRVRQDSTFGLWWMERWGYDQPDGPAGFLDTLAVCDSTMPTAPICTGVGSRWERIAPDPKPRPAKIAWLNVIDGSASDMAAAYAKGTPGVRIFAPNRTDGLFGGLRSMPGFVPGFSGGSVQIGDVRLGSSWAEIKAAPWHSGRGIEPDEVIAQTQSDLLAGKDTMLERARAWLLGP